MSAATVARRRGLRLPRLGGLGWVTWRQHRLALFGTVALLGGAALLLLITGLQMHHSFASLGLAGCVSPTATSKPLVGPQQCAVPLSVFQQQYGSWILSLPRFLLFLPCLIGAFVGGPLVARELESGTFRFAWTQGRSRTRWIVVKLGLIAAVLAALALLFSAVYSWWLGPVLPLAGRMSPGQSYEVAGVVFAARTVFGFTFGAFAGAVIRRTVPAMAVAAAGWLAVAWPSTVYLRQLIQAPVRTVDAPTGPAGQSVWIVSQWFQDTQGHRYSFGSLAAIARGTGVDSPGGFDGWLSRHDLTAWVSYEPASRFWHFQMVEGLAYLLLALIFAAATVWWVRHRAA